ncbi:hypothetical protein AWJ20_3898 [Sugiyamaella lignohabitans]|uniref:Transmembrane protein 135 N-terminal domain-containing protein n=1 Tax=Sugiyamaella lignohabitans TaxID=796027 RepID=A0A161HF69_9ASCO|nr:uncharacterized protein AWJ20_3898 [Sugiyamaella lignohabitans]ANB11101.1 hypothetical protein AWJ20_3898 [Sugiyamaella lignohabitans]
MDSSARLTAYTIRYVLSPREYRKLVARLNTNVTRILPAPEKIDASAVRSGDGVQSIVRSQSRLFAASYGLLGLINAFILKRRGLNIPALRIATSLTAISGIYKVLYRVLTLLLQRTGILPRHGLSAKTTGSSTKSRVDSSPSPGTTDDPESTCSDAGYLDNSYKITKLLVRAGYFTKRTLKKTKHLPPLLPALLSGLVAGSAFALFPESAQGYAAIYLSTRTLEFVYNYLDDMGYLEFKPRILKSWAIFPFAFSQLFYTFIFHPDACPNIFRRIMLRLSDGYIPTKPTGYPIDRPWPNPDQVVDGIATIARARYPKFVSPILFPNLDTTVPGLESAEPVLSLAHPAMSTLTGALSHPTQPSEFRTYTELVLSKYSSIYKYVFGAYVVLGLLKWRAHSKASSKTSEKNKLSSTDKASKKAAPSLPGILLSSVANTARTTTFIVMTAASSWYGIGLSQQVLNNKFIPVLRFRIIGFLAGLWAFADQVNGRARYMFAVRLALRSQWNVLSKDRRYAPLLKNGAAALFALSFAVLMAIFDLSPKSIPGPSLRKTLNWIKTNQYTDVTAEKEKDI